MDGIDNEWDAAIRAQDEERRQSVYSQMRADQEAVNAEMGDVVRRTAMESAKRQMSFNNLLASAVKFSGGGALPESVRNFMNRKMGFDGVRTGVLGGGWQQDGSYAFTFADGADRQGNVARKVQSFSPPALYSMMNCNRVAFDDTDRSTMRQRLLSSGLSEREVSDMGYAAEMSGEPVGRETAHLRRGTSAPNHISNMMGGGAGGREIGAGAVMKKVDRTPHALRAYSNYQAPGRRAGGRVFGSEADGTPIDYYTSEKKTEAENWRQVSVGAAEDGKTQVRRYINEVTGETVDVKDGETPLWRQGATSAKPSVEAAKVRAQGALDLEDKKQKGRLDLASLTGEQRKELQAAALVMRKYGIDVGTQTAREKSESAERVAAGNNETRLKVADISAALKKQGYEVDEAKLAEAVRHNKATEQLGQDKLANEKEQKESDRKLKRELVELRASWYRASRNGTTAPSRIREINEELSALKKVMDNGTAKDRKNARARVSALSDELNGKTVKGAATNGKAAEGGQVAEFDPNASYSVGDRFTRNGKTYQVSVDGKARIVK